MLQHGKSMITIVIQHLATENATKDIEVFGELSIPSSRGYHTA